MTRGLERQNGTDNQRQLAGAFVNGSRSPGPGWQPCSVDAVALAVHKGFAVAVSVPFVVSIRVHLRLNAVAVAVLRPSAVICGSSDVATEPVAARPRPRP